MRFPPREKNPLAWTPFNNGTSDPDALTLIRVPLKNLVREFHEVGRKYSFERCCRGEERRGAHGLRVGWVRQSCVRRTPCRSGARG